jgi:hypothetical protein
MASPSKIVLPNASFASIANFALIGTSVTPSYLAVYGGSLAGTLRNLATPMAAPATVLGANPTVSAGFATFSMFPESGLQINQSDALDWTWMGIIKGVGLVDPGVVNILGDRQSAPLSNINISFGNANNINLLQVLSPNGVVSETISLPAGTLETFGMYVFTGQSGVNVTAQNLTVGQSNAVNSNTTTSPFATGGPLFKVGTTSGATSSPGTLDACVEGFWPSVLSSGDQAIAATFMRNYAASVGITV